MKHVARLAALAIFVCLSPARLAASSPPDQPTERGEVHFRARNDQHEIPAAYRLTERTFTFELEETHEFPHSGVLSYHLRFPSPVVTDCPENNTVHAEYYRPVGSGPFPATIVLDITAGNQMLSRAIATQLAQHRIAALFVQMAYYGPRRPPGSRLHFLSTDVQRSMEAVRQTVLDLRCATAWLGARPEIDGQRLGILGTSLGSLMAALTAEMEPRLQRVAILLGGGGLVDAFYDFPQAAPARRIWETFGGTKQKLIDLMAPVDPLTCAANLRDHRVLMIAASRDEIIPRKATEALWRASGQQHIIWYDCTHYGAALYFVPAMQAVVELFTAP